MKKRINRMKIIKQLVKMIPEQSITIRMRFKLLQNKMIKYLRIRLTVILHRLHVKLFRSKILLLILKFVHWLIFYVHYIKYQLMRQ